MKKEWEENIINGTREIKNHSNDVFKCGLLEYRKYKALFSLPNYMIDILDNKFILADSILWNILVKSRLVIAA